LKRLLRTALIFLIRLLGAAGVRSTAQRARQAVPRKPRILLIRPGNLGDLVMTTPIIHALKKQAPDAHITMLVAPWSSEVVERHPGVDEVLICPFPSSRFTTRNILKSYTLLLHTAKVLRRGNYDLAISLRAYFWWCAALIYLARIPRRLGYAVEYCTSFLSLALPHDPQEHSTSSCLRLASAGLEALGYAPLEEPYTAWRYPLYFVPTAEEQEWVADRLRAEGIDANAALVVIHPGTGAPVKLWRAEAWADCATALTRASGRSDPLRIVLTGSKSERPLLEEVARNTPVCVTMITDASVGQLAALLRRAELVLGVDSGPLHLAVAQGTPTVQIFGPTDPRNYGPWGKEGRHAVITSVYRCPSCPCIPCGRLQFPRRELPSHPCVRLVAQEEVLTEVFKLLRSRVAS
jgi:lipopolysaccharide heptosyltransferase II